MDVVVLSLMVLLWSIDTVVVAFFLVNVLVNTAAVVISYLCCILLL